MPRHEYHVLSFGAGVQSTTLYMLAHDRHPLVPCTHAIFADTGEEPDSVKEHLQYLIDEFNSPPILIRSAGMRLGDDVKTRRNASTGSVFSKIPTFRQVADGKSSIGSRQCTNDYKVQVLHRAYRRDILGLRPRQRMPSHKLVYEYIGISTDEAARAERGKRLYKGVTWRAPKYPLLELGWSRKDCIQYLNERLPGRLVPKSACVFCPFQTSARWAELKRTDPNGWERAVEIDRALRTQRDARRETRPQYLHSSCIPLELIEWDKVAPNTIDPMTVNECTGMCGN